jgi:hypothetical protein
MPTIRFSSTLMQSTLGVRPGQTGGGYKIVTSFAAPQRLTSSTVVNTSLKIYSGLRPTWQALTSLSSRSGNLLITFNLPALTSTPALQVHNLGIVNNAVRLRLAAVTTPVTASTSGLATWFVLSPSVDNMTTHAGLMGDVGGIGSGADLEIVSPNITAGLDYVCGGIYLNFPLSWTF